MNTAVISGRLTQTPDLKYVGEKAVATFTLAVDRRFSKTKEADFIPCVLWGKAAELVAERTTKGNRLSLSGRIQVRSYDAKDGSKRYVTEVIGDQVDIIDWADSEPKHINDFSDMTPVDESDIPF
jgi:single-strand DNA-binding protein